MSGAGESLSWITLSSTSPPDAATASTAGTSVLVAGGAVTVLACPLLAQRPLARGHPDRVSPSPAPGT